MAMFQKWVADHFESLQIYIVGITLFVGWNTLKGRNQKSQFKVREADRTDLDRLHASKKTPDPAPQLLLPGIRLTGSPHEILGIGPTADEPTILKAYKDAIKKYHPDLIQGQTKEQLEFYQNASAKLNEAKEAMIEALRKSTEQ